MPERRSLWHSAWRRCFVQFTARGVGAVKGNIDSIKSGLSAIAGPAAAAAAAMTALAAGGLAGTIQGERLAGSFKHLAETVTSLFLPLINFASDAIRQFSERLAASESAERFQASMQRIAEALGPVVEQMIPLALDLFESMATILEKVVVPAIEAMAAAVEKLDKALKIAAVAMSPWQAMRDLWDAGGDANKALEQKFGRSQATAKRGGIDRVSHGAAKTEGMTDAYKRIQLALLNAEAGMNWPKKQAELQKEQLDAQREGNDLMRGLAPAVGR